MSFRFLVFSITHGAKSSSISITGGGVSLLLCATPPSVEMGRRPPIWGGGALEGGFREGR